MQQYQTQEQQLTGSEELRQLDQQVQHQQPRKLLNEKVFYRFFPGATSGDFYIAVLHMGINDILNLGSTADTVSNIILHIVNQCKNYGVKEVSISSVTCRTPLNSDLTNEVNNALQNKCQTSRYDFNDDNNTTT